MLIVPIVTYNGIWMFGMNGHYCFNQFSVINHIIINKKYTSIINSLENFMPFMYIGILFQPMNRNKAVTSF